jgi:hypothetical protein
LPGQQAGQRGGLGMPRHGAALANLFALKTLVHSFLKGLPMDKSAVLLFKAIHELKIDVPVMRSEVDNGKVILYLYGGQVLTWSPSKQTEQEPSQVVDMPASTLTISKAKAKAKHASTLTPKPGSKVKK